VRVYAVVSEQMCAEALELFVDRQIAEPDEGVENWDAAAALPLAFSDTAPPGAMDAVPTKLSSPQSVVGGVPHMRLGVWSSER
jgi:hypothetical protein